MTVDQAAPFFLGPFIQPDLKLTNTQLGLLASVYWTTFAITTYAMSEVADSVGKLKTLLVIMIVAVSVCSVMAAFANSFSTLLAARAVMGCVAGPLLPIAQSVVALESSPARRGTNMGIVVNVGSSTLQGIVAPLVLIKLAVLYGWRVGFLIIVCPSLVGAMLAARFIRDPTTDEIAQHHVSAARPSGGRLMEALSFHNIWLCIALSCLYFAYMILGFEFLPLYFVDVRHISSQQMSLLMSLLGIAAAVFGLLLPMASDRVGRRPVMVVSSIVSPLCPIAAIYCTGSTAFLAVVLFCGFAFSGTCSLILGTIPSETVPSRILTTAMGLVGALGVIGGGIAGPILAGWSADHWGIRTALLIQAGCAAVAGLLSMGLHETAPLKIKSAHEAICTDLIDVPCRSSKAQQRSQD
jgi:MFS family permease